MLATASREEGRVAPVLVVHAPPALSFLKEPGLSLVDSQVHVASDPPTTWDLPSVVDAGSLSSTENKWIEEWVHDACQSGISRTVVHLPTDSTQGQQPLIPISKLHSMPDMIRRTIDRALKATKQDIQNEVCDEASVLLSIIDVTGDTVEDRLRKLPNAAEDPSQVFTAMALDMDLDAFFAGLQPKMFRFLRKEMHTHRVVRIRVVQQRWVQPDPQLVEEGNVMFAETEPIEADITFVLLDPLSNVSKPCAMDDHIAAIQSVLAGLPKSLEAPQAKSPLLQYALPGWDTTRPCQVIAHTSKDGSKTPQTLRTLAFLYTILHKPIPSLPVFEEPQEEPSEIQQEIPAAAADPLVEDTSHHYTTACDMSADTQRFDTPSDNVTPEPVDDVLVETDTAKEVDAKDGDVTPNTAAMNTYAHDLQSKLAGWKPLTEEAEISRAPVEEVEADPLPRAPVESLEADTVPSTHLQNALDEAQKRIESLEEEVKKSSALQAQIQSLQENVAALSQAKQTEAERVKELEAALASATESTTPSTPRELLEVPADVPNDLARRRMSLLELSVADLSRSQVELETLASELEADVERVTRERDEALAALGGTPPVDGTSSRAVDELQTSLEQAIQDKEALALQLEGIRGEHASALQSLASFKDRSMTEDTDRSDMAVQTQLEDVVQERDALQSKLEQLEKDMEAMSTQVVEAFASRDQLTKEYEQLKNELEETNTTWVETSRDLQTQFSEKDSAFALLKEENAKLVAQLSDIQEGATRSGEVEEQAAAETKRLHGLIQELEAKLASNDHDRSMQQDDTLDAKDAEIQALQENIMRLQASLSDAESKLVDSEKNLALVSEKEAELQALQDKNATLEQQLLDLEAKDAEIESLKAQMATFETSKESESMERTQQVEDLEAAIATLQAQVAEADTIKTERDAASTSLSALETERASLAAELEQVRDQLKRVTILEEDLDKSRAETRELKSALDQLQAYGTKEADLPSHLDTLLKEIEGEEEVELPDASRAMDVQEDSPAAGGIVGRLRTRFLTLRSYSQSARGELPQLQSKLQELTAALEEAQGQNGQVAATLDATKEDLSTKEIRITELNAVTIDLEAKLADMSQQLQALKDESTIKDEALDALRDTQAAHEATIGSLNDQLAQAKSSLEASESQILDINSLLDKDVPAVEVEEDREAADESILETPSSLVGRLRNRFQHLTRQAEATRAMEAEQVVAEKAELETLRANLETTNVALSEKDRAIASLNDQVLALTSQLESLKSTNDKVALLTQELEESKSLKSKLEEDLSSKAQLLASKEQELEKVSAEWQDKLQAQEGKMAETQKQLDELLADQATRESSSQTEAEKLQIQLAALQAELDTTKSELSGIQRKANDVEATSAEKAEALATMEDANRTLKQQLADVHLQLEAMQESSKVHQDGLESILSSTQTRDIAESTSHPPESLLGRLQSHIAALSSQAKAHETQLVRANEESSSKELAVVALQESLEKEQSLVQDLTARVDQLSKAKAELDSFSSKLAENEERLASMEKEIQSVCAERDALQQEASHKTGRIAELESSMSILQESIQAATDRSLEPTEVDALRERASHVETLESQVSTLKTDLANLQAEADELKTKQSGYQQELAELSSLREQVDLLNKDVASKYVQIFELQKAVDASKATAETSREAGIASSQLEKEQQETIQQMWKRLAEADDLKTKQMEEIRRLEQRLEDINGTYGAQNAEIIRLRRIMREATERGAIIDVNAHQVTPEDLAKAIDADSNAVSKAQLDRYATLRDLYDQITTLQADKDELEQQLASSTRAAPVTTESPELKSRLQEVEGQLAAITLERDALSKSLAESAVWKEKVAALETELSASKAQHKTVSKSLVNMDGLKSTIETLQRQLDSTVSEKDTLSKSLQAADSSKELSVLQLQLANVTQSRDAAVQDAENERSRLLELSQKVVVMERQIVQYQEEAKAPSAAERELSSKTEQVERELLYLRDERDRLYNEKSTLTAELTTLQNRLKTLESSERQAKDLQTLLDAKQSEFTLLRKLETSHEGTIASLRERIVALESDVREAKAVSNTRGPSMDLDNETVQQLEADNRALREKIYYLETKIEALEVEQKQLAGLKKQAEGKCADLQRNLTIVTEELTVVRTKVEAAREMPASSKLQSEAVERRTIVEEAEPVQISTEQKQWPLSAETHDEYRRIIDELQTALDQAEEQCCLYAETINDYQEQYSTVESPARDTRLHLKTRIVQLEKRIESQSKEYADLQYELLKVDAAYKDAKERIQQLEDKIKAYKHRAYRRQSDTSNPGVVRSFYLESSPKRSTTGTTRQPSPNKYERRLSSPPKIPLPMSSTWSLSPDDPDILSPLFYSEYVGRDAELPHRLESQRTIPISRLRDLERALFDAKVQVRDLSERLSLAEREAIINKKEAAALKSRLISSSSSASTHEKRGWMSRLVRN